MKKYILNVSIMLLFAFLFACKSQNEALQPTPIQPSEPVFTMPTEPSFKGVFLGKEIFFKEQKGSWFNSSVFSSRFQSVSDPFNPLYITPKNNFSKLEIINGVNYSNAEEFTIGFPSALNAQDANNVERTISKLINVGKKELQYMPDEIAPTVAGNPFDKYVFSYWNRDTGNPNKKTMRISTIWGSQEGSTFEIISSKEIPKTNELAIRSFLVVFNVDCKMYEYGGAFAGTVKGIYTIRYDYRTF